jgi:hypothetical protein
VLAGHDLAGMSGTELLESARRLHPQACRGLLMPWGHVGDRTTGEMIFESITRGWIDHYVIRPSGSPDELFHQAITGLLAEWAEARRSSPYTIRVVGQSWSGRAYELRNVLGRCAMPHAFCLADSAEGHNTTSTPRRQFGSVMSRALPDSGAATDHQPRPRPLTDPPRPRARSRKSARPRKSARGNPGKLTQGHRIDGTE